MMMFRTVRDALVTILGDGAESRFRVIGYQRQSKNADEVLSNDRLVQVYFSDGEFTKSAGRMMGHKTHNVSYEIDMSASAPAKGDLSVLDSTTSTAIQKAAALAAVKEAAEEADTQVDELIEYVYQILMDARNEGLGLTKGDISSRWIGAIQKDTIIERGDLVVKTANMKYTCRVQETVLGDIGNEPETVVFDSDVPVDDVDGAGVINE